MMACCTGCKVSGTFVAEGKGHSSVFEVRNIADEITERGHSHTAHVLVLNEVRATPELADALGIDIGVPAYHSVIIHSENDIPVQLEDRYVNPTAAPDYLAQDFGRDTPKPLPQFGHSLDRRRARHRSGAAGGLGGEIAGDFEGGAVSRHSPHDDRRILRRVERPTIDAGRAIQGVEPAAGGWMS